MTIFKVAVVAVVLAMFIGLVGAEPGFWSRAAIPLSIYPEETQRFPAPDGKSIVLARNHKVFLLRDKKGPVTAEAPVDVLGELGWAPDSKAFFVTSSDGGDVGRWYVIVFRVIDGHLEEAIVSRLARTEFMRTYQCYWGGKKYAQEPNLGAVRWLKDSEELLLLAEVPRVSTCPAMPLMGYAVRVPSGEIIATYSEIEVRKRWASDLGDRHRKPGD